MSFLLLSLSSYFKNFAFEVRSVQCKVWGHAHKCCLDGSINLTPLVITQVVRMSPLTLSMPPKNCFSYFTCQCSFLLHCRERECVCVCVWCLNTCLFFNGLHVHVHVALCTCVLGPSFPSLTMSWTCDGIVLQSVTNLFLTCTTICYMRRRRRRRRRGDTCSGVC